MPELAKDARAAGPHGALAGPDLIDGSYPAYAIGIGGEAGKPGA